MIPSKLKQKANVYQQMSGRQIFLAKYNEIQQALESGCTAKEVWMILYQQGILSIQYRTFMSYMKLSIKENEQSASYVPHEIKAVQKRVKQRKKKRFEFNARGKSLEELI
ncbi:TraK family protein [Candidatus Nitrosacidococcus tergens]|uniref:Uncharacterized protein n=1 Tax=Candidatus Nitrosacidococcus tergens TaxID=553981 RepID=A0A7G1Q928_9GAMM|nr:TraK family protein [Candidatus Nitrosacidococcus tergens]CAB1275627.1 conserved protein of unknown function [Candidatus Nitrosacidococcus tergens]